MMIERVRMFGWSRVALTCALTALFCLSASGTARAQSIAIELDLGIPVGDTTDVLDLGWGIEGRAGFGLPVPAITFDAEVLFDWYSFPYDNFDERMSLWRAAAGIRIGVPIPFVPEIFGHLGYGKESADLGGVSFSDSGFTWDVGVAVDVFSVSVFSVGIHLGYKVLNPPDEEGVNIKPTRWVGLGLHGELGF